MNRRRTSLLTVLSAAMLSLVTTRGWAQSPFGAAYTAELAESPQTESEQPEVEPAAWREDEKGRRFRVGFDPGSRWLFGLGYGLRYGSSPATGDGEGDGRGQFALALLDTGLAMRHIVDFPAERVGYKLYHQGLRSRVWFDAGAVSQFETTLYAGRFMRWSRDGQIVVPSTPPKRIPFPLNIGMQAEIGQLQLTQSDTGYGAEIGVTKAEVLLDFWRQRRLGSHAQFGFGPSYDIWLDGHEQLQVEHVIAPFTRASFGFHHESTDGHHSIDCSVAGSYAVAVDAGWGWRFRAQADYEAILLAVNDLPLSAYGQVAYRFAERPVPTRGTHDLRASAGLRFAVPIDP